MNDYDLRTVYVCIAITYALSKRAEEAEEWLGALERAAMEHRDSRALAEVSFFRARDLHAAAGDLRGAVGRYERALSVYASIGDRKHEGRCLIDMAQACLGLGDIGSAKQHAQEGIDVAEALALRGAAGHEITGVAALCESSWTTAREALRTAARIRREVNWAEPAAMVTARLGRVELRSGRREEAQMCFEEAVTLSPANSLSLAYALSGLDELCTDQDALRAVCRPLREERAGDAAAPIFQWHLDPSQPHILSNPEALDELAAPLGSHWIWQDPFHDCSFGVDNGLKIRAANGRDLWHINLSAPRLLRPASGDFAAQTVCVPPSDEQPAIGGLLLWRDKENYLRLDRGTRGKHEISFQGCLDNEDVILGRGWLPAERIFLRLERRGDRVRALCSAEGEQWFTVGQVAFPVEDPVEVGLHAIGNIDRTIYPGAYPEGTAIRFECFELWG